jgi:hypothetical protein
VASVVQPKSHDRIKSPRCDSKFVNWNIVNYRPTTLGASVKLKAITVAIGDDRARADLPVRHGDLNSVHGCGCDDWEGTIGQSERRWPTWVRSCPA